MQSKTSFFNKTLFRKNLTRFWPLWGGASFLGALFPLALMLQLTRGVPTYMMKDPLEFTSTYYSVVTCVPIISLLYAILCAMVVWSYLYNTRSTGMMHTLPIRREGIFATNFLSGMAMMIIPYAVTGGLCVLLSIICSSFDPVGLINTILSVLGMSFFYFASATFVAFITGNIFALPALYFLFHFLAELIEFIFTQLASDFLVGVNAYYTGALCCLSPTVYLTQRLGVARTYTDPLPVRSGAYAPAELISVELENAWLIGVYALVGAVFLALAWLLYRRRRSESAGDVVAVGWMKPVFRYGVAALAALLGGRLLYALFWEGTFQSGVYCDALPMAVCMIVAGVIGYYAASMLLTKSLRVFRKSWLGIALVAVGCAAVCGILRFDLLGIEGRVPDTGEIDRVFLYVKGNSYYLYPGEDDALIEDVRQLHQAFVDKTEYFRKPYEELAPLWIRDDIRSDTYSQVYLQLEYQLSSGHTLNRSYLIPLAQSRVAQQGTFDYLLDQLINGEAMKAKRLHFNDPHYTVTDGSVYQYIKNDVGESFDLNSREAAAVLEAVGKDAKAGTWGQVDWFDQRTDSSYALEVYLSFTLQLPGEQGMDSDGISIYVWPEMTNTLACLEELGLIDRSGLITWEQYNDDSYDAAVLAERVPAETEYVYEDPPASLGVIGGADGPTQVYVAGSVG